MGHRRAQILVGELLKECKSSGIDCIVLLASDEIVSVRDCLQTPLQFKAPYTQRSIELLGEKIVDRALHTQRTTLVERGDEKLDLDLGSASL